MTENTKTLLRLLAYQGEVEVEVEVVADRTGLPLDKIRVAAVEGWFEVWALDERRSIVLVARWVEHCNTVRLHSTIDYITPTDRLASRGPAIWATRDASLEAAREVRRLRRAELHQAAA